MARAPRGNVAPSLSSFVGRRRELAQIASLIAKTRLLTIAGPGGVGKSRLAVVAASRRVQGVAGGVWLVELARVRDGRLVADAVAEALGVVGQEGEPIEKSLVE